MSSLRWIAFGCVILVVLSGFADGLSCYKCTGCDSPFKPNEAIIVNASDNQGYQCLKTTVRNVGTTRNITKDCSQGNILGVGQWCCTTDLCNGATQTASSIYLILTVATVVATMLF